MQVKILFTKPTGDNEKNNFVYLYFYIIHIYTYVCSAS